MKKSILLTAVFAFLSFCLSAQTKYATIKIIEGNQASSICIVYDDLQSEIIKMPGLGFGGLNIESMLENQKKVTTTLNQIAEKGYTLVSESSFFDQSIKVRYTHYTFKKD